MATIFYLPAGLIPNDTGGAPATTIAYMPAGGPPTDIVSVGGGKLIDGFLIDNYLVNGSLVS